MSLSALESQIKVIGGLLIILALLHAWFPAYFKWKQDLSSLMLINRQIMQVHMFFIALGVFLMGILCLQSSHELLYTPLGRRLLLGMSIFWGLRLTFQFFVYSSRLWKGKLFETTIHVLFSLFWMYVTVVFLLSYLA